MIKKLYLVLTIVICLVSCDHHLYRYEDNFYNLVNTKGINLPLVKPYYITYDEAQNNWFMNSFIMVTDLNNLCAVFDIERISVNSSYILLSCKENFTNYSGCGNFYFIISPNNESLTKGFDNKKEFENYLSEMQIHAKWLNINNVWISYTDTGYLPWEEEIKLSRK